MLNCIVKLCPERQVRSRLQTPPKPRSIGLGHNRTPLGLSRADLRTLTVRDPTCTRLRYRQSLHPTQQHEMLRLRVKQASEANQTTPSLPPSPPPDMTCSKLPNQASQAKDSSPSPPLSVFHSCGPACDNVHHGSRPFLSINSRHHDLSHRAA